MRNEARALDRHAEQLWLAVRDSCDGGIPAILVREKMTRRDPQPGSGNEAERRQASKPHNDDPPNVRHGAAGAAVSSLPPALPLTGKAAEMR